MRQPIGFEDSMHPTHICKLRKAIYGLKQAPRQWHTTFTEHLLRIGFQHSKVDPSLLTFTQNSNRIFLLVYVDYILITGSSEQTIAELITKLNDQFHMKYLGQAKHFMGITISSEPAKYFLSQKSYAQSILAQANLISCKSLANPSCTKLQSQLTQDQELTDPNIYRRITGALQYLTITRPDIAYAVNILSQNMHSPSTQHSYLLKRLLRYIQGTISFGLPIIKSNLHLRSFSDADWAGDPLTRKSTSGYCTFLGANLVSWTVKKQKTVSRSSTESEYRALAAATADILWLQRLISDFGITSAEPTQLFCDNTSAIALAHNPVFHARTKHIEIDHRFIRDNIQNNNIHLQPISTIDQIADILTKPLSMARFKMLRDKLMITLGS
ncbi:uncharacterized protein LOC110095891 [Dendrobium catenatum]|uniref:uncharacterized protein LOC110095891 n=1 Tax=Dendrobium catenatum TaxID=906689 RepID=UPI0009F19404|nr:uncharacterized protein LOC110095891 [Dendrobium catenatum]